MIKIVEITIKGKDPFWLMVSEGSVFHSPKDNTAAHIMQDRNQSELWGRTRDDTVPKSTSLGLSSRQFLIPKLSTASSNSTADGAQEFKCISLWGHYYTFEVWHAVQRLLVVLESNWKCQPTVTVQTVDLVFGGFPNEFPDKIERLCCLVLCHLDTN